MNLDGSDSKKILDLTKEKERYHYTTNPWSPNGHRLAIQNFDTQNKIYQILITDLNGSSKNLTEGTSSILPRWSPDGEKIVFLRLGKENYDLVLTNLEDATSTTIVAGVLYPKKHKRDLLSYLAPSWSPDGKEIAYVNGQQIAVVNLETREIKDLTHGSGYKIFPRWSPDGKWIAFNKVRFRKKEPLYGESRVELFITDTEGKNPKILTYLKGESYLPQWSPSGDRLAFLFAIEDAASFLPGIVDLTGHVKFFPINGYQKIGLAKYYLNYDASKDKEAQNLLKEVVQESPKTKWAEEAQSILTVIEDQKKESKSALKSGL
jgi:Tol biopolymer transport system component